MRPGLLAFLIFVSLTSRAQEIVVQPYLQPGNASTLSKEQKVVIWQTDSVSGAFKVEFAPGLSLEGLPKVSVAKVSFVHLNLLGKKTYLYRATLGGLNFDADYTYRVRLNDKIISSNTFTTRTRKPLTRFAVWGDCGTGSPQQAAIAYQAYLQKPQFVLVTGDLVYNNGLEREYRARFFPAYTSPEASPEKGVPFMQTTPFYMFVGNHDVYGSDLQKWPDGLAFFYYSDLPQNAPITTLTTEVTGPPERVKAFKKATDGRFPKLANYSFDYGNVHITCLDANSYVNPVDFALLEWLKNDIGSSKADWKIVAYHHPGFNSSKAHYDYQHMRLLSPLLEELGVDMVLNGHVHNYQRSLPLKFSPKMNEARDKYIVSPEGRVDGTFTLDPEFDGVTNTKPKGIIYIVTGAGGAGLYDPVLSGKPDLWKHEPQDNWVPFTAKIVSDIHSFTMIETNGKTLTLKQLNAKGEAFDEIKVTK